MTYADTTQRHRVRLVTLSFVRSGDAVLLMRHPETSDRFRGLWNGVGGHVEPGEDIRAAARRELREESGLDVDGLRLRGVIHETGLIGHAHVVFLFVGEAVRRELASPEAKRLVWQPLDRIGELPLVDDLAELLPRLLRASEPLFVTKSYGGGDGLLAMRADDAGADRRV